MNINSNEIDSDIVQNYISNNKETSKVLETYYDFLFNLNKETYQDTIQYVDQNKNVFFKDHSSGLSFFHYTVLSSLPNFKKFEIYLDICIEFKSDFDKLSILENELIQDCNRFSNIAYYLFSKNFFSITTIVNESSINNFIFINFLPEIKQYDNEYAEKRINNLLFEHKNENEISFLHFVSNNPKEHVLYRNLNYHPSYIHKLIRDDNVIDFSSYLSKNNISFNYKIPFSYYERAKTIDKELSLIKCAAIYGSINIFKYLWNQATIIGNDILEYAYCGQNYDIIHICENKYSSEKAFDQSLFINSKELIEYSFNLYKKEVIDNSNENTNDNQYQNIKIAHLHKAVKALNYNIIYSNLQKILLSARNDDHINNNSFRNGFLCDSIYDLNLFKLIFAQRNADFQKEQCGCFNTCILFSLRRKNNDAFKIIFNDLYKNLNFLYLLQEGIQNNHEIANYILDLQIDEMNSNNLDKCIIFTFINKRITFDDLKLAIKHYNENIVIKMIKLYDFFKNTENIFNFISTISYNISKKMMYSLLNQLSSILPKNISICFYALLNDQGYSLIFNDINKQGN